jgi:intracellular sulfur oxidation DsrE/DsrF family protein
MRMLNKEGFLRSASAVLALLAFLLSGAVYADYVPQKVVYHFNAYGASGQTAGLRNIQNHINAVGADQLDVAVVMHGNGLSLLTLPEAVGATKMKEGNAATEMQARVDGLRNQGVRFLVCANTLKGRKVVPDEHLYRVSAGDIVPSGVAELSKLQQEGYTYIKP